MWQAWVNGILGLWLIISSFSLTRSTNATETNSVIMGVIIAVLAFSTVRQKTWHGIINGILGLWLVLSGLLFSANHAFNFWNYVAVGIIIALIGFSSTGGPERMAERQV